MTYVLDASAVLRFIDHEAEVVRVAEIFTQVRLGTARAIISAIHYGEIVGIAHKRGGRRHVDEIILQLNSLNMLVIAADGKRAAQSGILDASLKVPYADSFALELASQPDHVLVTADFDFKPAALDIAIEFLPTKSKP